MPDGLFDQGAQCGCTDGLMTSGCIKPMGTYYLQDASGLRGLHTVYIYKWAPRIPTALDPWGSVCQQLDPDPRSAADPDPLFGGSGSLGALGASVLSSYGVKAGGEESDKDKGCIHNQMQTPDSLASWAVDGPLNTIPLLRLYGR